MVVGGVSGLPVEPCDVVGDQDADRPKTHSGDGRDRAEFENTASPPLVLGSCFVSCCTPKANRIDPLLLTIWCAKSGFGISPPLRSSLFRLLSSLVDSAFVDSAMMLDSAILIRIVSLIEVKEENSDGGGSGSGIIDQRASQNFC
jgi:hypothetical protein